MIPCPSHKYPERGPTVIKRRNIDSLRMTHFIGAERFGLTGTLSGSATTQLGTGPMKLTETSSFGYAHLGVQGAADVIMAIDFEMPRVMDPTKPIGVRVMWMPTTTSVVATDRIHWLVTYQAAKIGATLATPVAGTGTALNTVIATQGPTATTALRLHRGNRGIINANVLDMGHRNGAIVWAVEADVLTNFTTDEVAFLGLELDFYQLDTVNGTESAEYRASLVGA